MHSKANVLSQEEIVEKLKLIQAESTAIRYSERALQIKFYKLTGDLIDYEQYGHRSMQSFLFHNQLEALILQDVMLSPRIKNTRNDDSDSDSSKEEAFQTVDDYAQWPTVSDGKNHAIDDLIEVSEQFQKMHLDVPRLPFPWGKRFWRLQVTHLHSASKVWVRFVDSDDNKYSFRHLCVELTKCVQKRSLTKKAVTIQLYGIYASKVLQKYYRVRVLKLYKNTALCFFLDIGNEKWLNSEDLIDYDEGGQLRVPPLAFCLKLNGLNAFSINENAQLLSWMSNYLVDKVILASMSTTRDDYQNAIREFDDAAICATLYDTTANRMEIRNLNNAICEKVCQSLQPPELTANQFNRVEVQNVSGTGIVYCHNSSSKAGMNTIDTAIKDINGLTNMFLTLPSRDEVEMHSGKKVLVLDSCHNRVCRAVIADQNFRSAIGATLTKIKCTLVDYGRIDSIPFNKIFTSTLLLEKYPYQAIGVELANIDNVSGDILKQIHSLLKPGDIVFMEVERTPQQTIYTQVQVYKIVESAKTFGLVNEFLRKQSIIPKTANGVET